MDTRTRRPGPRPLSQLAYDRGTGPRGAVPGPLFDLAVVGLFLFLAAVSALA